MKKRKNFRHIVVDGQEYQYIITNQGVERKQPMGVIIYDIQGNKHHVKDLHTLGIPTQGSQGEGTWRGKHGECVWGKHQIAYVIKNILKK